MEMEDHHRHEYGMADLRQLMNGRATHFGGIPQAGVAAELFPGHRNLTNQGGHHHHTYHEMLMMPRGLQEFNNSSTSVVPVITTSSSVSTPSTLCGLEGDGIGFGGDGGTGRWPRQETLTLLEIRSRLDSKFKEANQKGPLWDEVSRIMSEEHGYQRSGKKCREKFENLYKYYKKTKEGKAGRQDGKNYRFFRQLEALYGDTTTANNTTNSVSILPDNHHLVGTTLHFHNQTADNNNNNNSLSLSANSSDEFDSSSSDTNDSRRKKRGWKTKIKEFIDGQMKKLMERQEVWLEKLTKTLEQKEQERVLREEEWKRQEEARVDREHKFWAKERAWIEARDTALMEALHNLTASSSNTEPPAFNDYLRKTNKKRKESAYFPSGEPLYTNNQAAYCEISEHEPENVRLQPNDNSSSPSNSNVGNAVSESCFRYLMNDGDNLWENYGLKISKGGNGGDHNNH